MTKKIKNKMNLIFLILIYSIGIQVISNSLLTSKINEINNETVTNINTFLTLINLLIVIVSIIIVFLQSCLYKIFILFFQIEKEITISKNFSHVLKGTIPFTLLALVLPLFIPKENLIEIINMPMIKIENIILSTIIYIFFLKKDLNMNLIKSFIFGSMLIVFNVIFTFGGQLIINI